nr:antitoxin Xre/MbcA/ParS toxin-binding domain-containing protein [Burkholderia ubonensis]
MKTCRCCAWRSECVVERVPDEIWNRLVNLVQKTANESGEPDGFDAKRWLCTWLHEEVPSLGRKKPIAFFDSVAGEELVIRTLLSMQTGAYR